MNIELCINSIKFSVFQVEVNLLNSEFIIFLQFFFYVKRILLHIDCLRASHALSNTQHIFNRTYLTNDGVLNSPDAFEKISNKVFSVSEYICLLIRVTFKTN